jgi:hypothetical protein
MLRRHLRKILSIVKKSPLTLFSAYQTLPSRSCITYMHASSSLYLSGTGRSYLPLRFPIFKKSSHILQITLHIFALPLYLTISSPLSTLAYIHRYSYPSIKMTTVRSLVLLSVLLVSSSVTAQLPSSPLNSRSIEYPEFRYLQYRFLDAETLVLAGSMGYSADTWDRPGTDIIELIGFEGMGLGKSEVLGLGFSESQWDCYMNHYIYYEWDLLVDMGVQDFLLELGWTQDNWGGSTADTPEIYNSDWEDLTDEQRGNATEVCYFQESWNGDFLQDWTTGPPTEPPTLAPSMISASPTEAPTSSSGFGLRSTLLGLTGVMVLALPMVF